MEALSGIPFCADIVKAGIDSKLDFARPLGLVSPKDAAALPAIAPDTLRRECRSLISVIFSYDMWEFSVNKAFYN